MGETGSDWAGYIVAWVLCGLISALVWQRKGGRPWDGFFYGFILGPIGILIAALRTPSAALQVSVCPYCRKRIHPEAVVCPHCRRDIPLEHRPPPQKSFEGFADVARERAERKRTKSE